MKKVIIFSVLMAVVFHPLDSISQINYSDDAPQTFATGIPVAAPPPAAGKVFLFKNG